MNDSPNPVMVAKWSKEEVEAIQNRDAHEDSMDIFDMKVSKVGGIIELQPCHMNKCFVEL